MMTGADLFDAGADLLDGDTGPPVISQRSEAGRGMLCAIGGIGKYDKWYGVVCKDVLSSSMSARCSLPGGRDTVSYLVMTTIVSDGRWR